MGKRTLRSLNPGDSYRIQTKEGWKSAKVVRASAEPRSYVVETETGQNRRNRNSLLKTRENIVLPHIEELEPENEPKPTPSTGPTPQSSLPASARKRARAYTTNGTCNTNTTITITKIDRGTRVSHHQGGGGER
ncbi:hypothetical protein LSH36_53g03014 [Paralvinella palmiformis]|uniref:Uncharacterized protein n=1 Tax=Paralvinella palmiformis TaxID=53620 RepID=A0AAD9K5A6_9ANNE|nr:hypothetical protein LSH36_53g03014 [Paralvinella palmiformis]